MLQRLTTMLVKEFIQILRDPKMRFVILVVPLFQIVMFGYAVNTDVKHVATAVYDLDNSRESREFIARLSRSGYFDIAMHVDREGELGELLDSGRATMALKIGPGFAGALTGGRSAPVQVIVDGSEASSAGIIVGHVTAIAARFGDMVLVEQLARQRGGLPRIGRVTLAGRSWFNENLESRNYYVPGVSALLLLITTMMLSSMAVVREKEIGTMEQIIVTPIRRWEFILGKTIPFACIGYTNLLVVTLVAIFWFDIPFRGNVLVLVAATSAYMLCTLGFGLFISTVSHTQQQAMMSSFMFTFPAMLLSGFAFPIANMPPVIQWFTFLNPLRYYLVILRGVFLKGIGFGVLWPELVGLLILGGTILPVAIWRFRKTVS